jgi:hypothetical protein
MPAFFSEPNVRDLARAAADVLRRRGWQRGGSMFAHGPCCTLNAVADSREAFDFATSDEVYRRACRILGLTPRDRLPGSLARAVQEWNDDVAQPGDAIAVLDGIANGRGIS